MDEWLAQVYGTGGSDDLEKTAQVMMLQKLAEQEGVDLSSLNDEELEALADEVASNGEETEGQEAEGQEGQEAQGEEGQEGVEYADPQEEMAKEAQAKFEEADFLGRVMAHSYTQELEKIAEDAAKKPGMFRRGYEAAKSGVKSGAKGYGHALAGGKGAKGFMERLKGLKGQRGKVWGARGGTAAALGAAGYGLNKALSRKTSKTKTAAYIEKMAEARAVEMLSEAGLLNEK